MADISRSESPLMHSTYNAIQNMRNTKQGKLETVKQNMEHTNFEVIGVNELKWTEIGYFSDKQLHSVLLWK